MPHRARDITSRDDIGDKGGVGLFTGSDIVVMFHLYVVVYSEIILY